MNTDKLIQFFNSKLNNISGLRRLNDYRDPAFTTWWNTIISTCGCMGQQYKQRVDRIHFYPGMVVGGADNSARYAKAYHRGLDNAEALVKSIIEELETWGYSPGDNEEEKDKETKQENAVVLNLTISQQQAQQITQNINLSQYDKEVQEKIQELLDELKKETKNKSKIASVVKWLADKGVDALIAILLASTHLT